MRFFRLALLLVVVLALAEACAASPKSPDPAAPVDLEKEPIRTTADPGTTGLVHTVTGSSDTGDSGLIRVVLALVVVVMIIFILRAVARKMQLVPGGGKSHRAVRVLSRTSISPRQQIILMQVGRRLIVVGDSGGRLSALSDITDPDEVAALVGQTQNETIPKPEPAVFEKAFTQASEPFEQVRVSEEPNPEIDNGHKEIVGLLDQVRTMRQQFNQVQ